MEIGERIRQMRIELGLSQDGLAKLVGYKSRSSVNKIEIGERDITQSTILAFSKALHTTPSTLMGWEQTETDKMILSKEHQNLLDLYDQLHEDDKIRIITKMETIIEDYNQSAMIRSFRAASSKDHHEPEIVGMEDLSVYPESDIDNI